MFASERFLLIQTFFLLAGVAWSRGGMWSGLRLPMVIVTLLALPALWLAKKEGLRLRWWRWLPFLGFLLYVGGSLLNPSHFPQLDGTWKPNPGWISWLPGTLDIDRSLYFGAPFAAVLLQATLLREVLRTREASRVLQHGIVLHTLLMAMVGALVWSTQSEKLLWFSKVIGGQFFCSFVYKNHWVAFALPAAAAAAGWAFALWDRGHLDRKTSNLRLFAFCACALILCTFPLPVSRSGTVMGAILLIMILFGITRRFLRQQKARTQQKFLGYTGLSLALGAVVAGILYLNWPSIEEGWKRSENEYNTVVEKGEWNTRVYMARDTLRMASDRPVYGWGAGSYEPIFALYMGDYVKNPDGKQWGRIDYAHCDWAQVPAEYGLIGFLLLLAPVVGLLWSSWKAESPRATWTRYGCLFILIYATMEFPFQNPAVLLQWSLLLVVAAFRRE